MGFQDVTRHGVLAVHGLQAEEKMDDDEALTKAINDLRFMSPGCKADRYGGSFDGFDMHLSVRKLSAIC